MLCVIFYMCCHVLIDFIEVPLLEHLPRTKIICNYTLQYFVVIDRVVQDLVAISKYLAGPGQTTDFMSVYHQIRSTQLGRSLAA